MADYTLYGYYRSSCTARLRLALNYKGLSYEHIPVNLITGEQRSPEFIKFNPSASVPLLVVKPRDGSPGFSIGQSPAGLEYLEEAHPEAARRLLPAASDPAARGRVRVLCAVIACDVQPVTNLRIMKRVKDLGGDPPQWNRDIMAEGLRAYETLIQESGGAYSVGDEVTLADLCLVPAVWNAQRYGVDLDKFPTVMRVFDHISKDEAVVKAHWQNQPDTPEELRAK